MRSIIAIALITSVIQATGQRAFNFMNLPAGPRVAALGGYAVSPADGDLSISFHNPAITDSVSIGDLFFMYNPYFADISRLSAISYMDYPKIGPMTIGVVYLNYGTFDETDLIGNKVGTFNGRDFVIYAGKSHHVGPFGLGINLKYSGSVLSTFSAHAISMDIGGIFRHPTQEMSVGIVIKNLGLFLSDNSVAGDLSLPFDVEIGTTFKPEHMPFRFTITGSNLTRSLDELYFGEFSDPNLVNEFLRYLNVGTELIIGRSIELLLGYNHRRREEMKLQTTARGAGFSYGLLIKIKDYHLRFTQTTFHAGGGSSFISLRGNVNSIKKIF